MWLEVRLKRIIGRKQDKRERMENRPEGEKQTREDFIIEGNEQEMEEETK